MKLSFAVASFRGFCCLYLGGNRTGTVTGAKMLESAEPSGRRSNMKRRDFLKSAGGAAATATAGDTFSGTHQIFLAAGSRQQLHGIWSTAPYSKLLTPAGSSR